MSNNDMKENHMSKKKRVSLSPPRNYLFNHPLMKKGAVHQKSNKVKRQAEKTQLRKEWYHPIAA